MKQFKPFFSALLMIVFTINTIISQNDFYNRHILDPYNPEYVEGEVLVKFKDDIVVEVKTEVNSENEILVTTGIKSIDEFLVENKAFEIEKVFTESRESSRAKSGGATTYMTDFKGQRYEVPQLYNIYKLRFDEARDAKQLAGLISRDPLVDYAEPNYMVYAMNVLERNPITENPGITDASPPQNRGTDPNDAFYVAGEQWYLTEINAPSAWDSVTGDTAQIIGIIDTGIDWDHPDLDGNIYRNWDEIPDNGIDDDGNGYIDDIRGWDFHNNDNNPDDDNGHGTHVAGIAAAETDNWIGIAGVSWNSKLLPVKVLSAAGSGSVVTVANGVIYAANQGASIINMSLGTYGESQTLKIALENAYAYSTLIAAAGNDSYKVDSISPPSNPYGPAYPGCYPFVIGVEATSPGNILAPFSNIDPSGFELCANDHGHNYEIKAPGMNIMSTFPGGAYHQLHGTSMASPVVSGAIALLKSYIPEISNEEIFARLIQYAQGGLLKIPNILFSTLESDLLFIDFTIIDTIAGCDNDGFADAGETIEIFYTIKNAGGYADSSWSKLRLGQFEDTSLVHIIDSTSFIGDLDSAAYINGIPAYTTLTGEYDPFRLTIDSNVINNRDIVFEYEIGAKNPPIKTGEFVLNIQNGEELLGIMDSVFYLTPDKLWIVNDSYKVGNNGILYLKPGTNLILNYCIINDGLIIGHGNPDSLINIEGPCCLSGNLNFSYTNISNITVQHCLRDITGEFNHCLFTDFNNGFMSSNIIMRDCQLIGAGTFFGCTGIYERNNFEYDGHAFHFTNGIELRHNNIYGNLHSEYLNPSNALLKHIYGKEIGDIVYNNFIASNDDLIYTSNVGDDYDFLPFQYWGSENPDKIDKKIYDFWDDASRAWVKYSPILITPSDSAHGMVWKVHVNGIDAQDGYLDPLGAETAKFEVYFNKPMDTIVSPFLSFGVRYPYTQHTVNMNASWSEDSTIWTAYYDIDLETGDGLNFIRVSDAIDTAGFIVPVEDYERFKFIIQAASSIALDFNAIPGIGKVYLEWPHSYTNDILGYNMYRFQKVNDSVNTDTLLINSELIIDSTYIDYAVIPDTTYYYCYKTLGTDLIESDFSKVISANPLSSANGDANGDGQTNVLDITTVISFILEQDPQPFLFEAADVNEDGDVNILDVMGISNIINTTKSDPRTTRLYGIDPAFADLVGNIFYLESKGNVAGLQFEITGEDIDAINLMAKLDGFELTFNKISSDKIICLVYNYNQNIIPEGKSKIIEFIGADSSIYITSVLGSDAIGNSVQIIIGNQKTQIRQGLDFNVFPNPSTGIFNLEYLIHAKSYVNIDVFDFYGIHVASIVNDVYPPGKHHIVWNVKDGKLNSMSQGVYFCRISVISFSDELNELVETVKLIYLE